MGEEMGAGKPDVRIRELAAFLC